MSLTVTGETKKEILKFIADYHHRQPVSSNLIATRTINLIRDLIQNEVWTTAKELIHIIKENGKFLSNALPECPSIANVTRRVLKIIREEFNSACKNEKQEYESSLYHIVSSDSDREINDWTKVIPELKEMILDHISEIQLEIETSIGDIVNQGPEYIYSNEIILTLGNSSLVEKFLKKAARTRNFQVIVVECAPGYEGHTLAENLSSNKIPTTVIPDSNVFAVMSRVHKVIIGTNMVLSNAGLRAVSGTNTVALAAQYYSRPVFALSPLYKLSTVRLCSYEEDFFNKYESPEKIMPFHSEVSANVQVYNPCFDYVQPSLVKLFVTNKGGIDPSKMFEQLIEMYHQDDYYDMP